MNSSVWMTGRFYLKPAGLSVEHGTSLVVHRWPIFARRIADWLNANSSRKRRNVERCRAAICHRRKAYRLRVTRMLPNVTGRTGNRIFHILSRSWRR